MAMRTARDNILAGGFVVAGVVLAVWSSFMLGERTGVGRQKAFTVRFPLSNGAAGLKAGSPVLLGGQPFGRVVSTQFYPANSAPTGVDVSVRVPAGVPLFDNATIALDRPLLGSLSSINISDAGSEAGVKTPIGSAKTVEDGDVLPGGLAPPAFLAQAGLGQKEIADIRNIITTLDTGLTKVSNLIERVSPQAEQGVTDAKQLISDLREKVKAWSESVDRIAANVDKASARLDPMLSDAHEAIKDARVAVADIQKIISDNKERIDRIAANVESATAKIDKTTVDEANAALRSGREAIQSFSDTIAKVSGLITEETPNVRRVLANLRLMSDNLKLTAIEVRSQPWRALHAPTTKELSTQSLYDATRAYAEAASDAPPATPSTLRHGAARSTLGDNDDTVSKALTDAMVKYQQAEQRLFDVLVREEKK